MQNEVKETLVGRMKDEEKECGMAWTEGRGISNQWMIGIKMNHKVERMKNFDEKLDWIRESGRDLWNSQMGFELRFV